MEYPHSFFIVCLETLGEYAKEAVINSAIAHRGAKVEDFEEFVNSIRGKKKEVDHSANIANLRKALE